MKNSTTVILQRETVDALSKIPAGCVNARSARLGIFEGEPLLVMADALLSYAKAYRARFEQPINSDGVAHKAFGNMLRGVKTMLDFDGAVALRRGITTDSKDNACICDILEAACKIGGYDWNNL